MTVYDVISLLTRWKLNKLGMNVNCQNIYSIALIANNVTDGSCFNSPPPPPSLRGTKIGLTNANKEIMLLLLL